MKMGRKVYLLYKKIKPRLKKIYIIFSRGADVPFSYMCP